MYLGYTSSFLVAPSIAIFVIKIRKSNTNAVHLKTLYIFYYFKQLSVVKYEIKGMNLRNIHKFSNVKKIVENK